MPRAGTATVYPWLASENSTLPARATHTPASTLQSESAVILIPPRSCQHLAEPSWSPLPPPWQLRGCPSIPVLRQGPFPPGFCRSQNLGLSAHIQTCGGPGGAGGGVQNGCQDGWSPSCLPLSPSLSLPLSPSLPPFALFPSRIVEERGWTMRGGRGGHSWVGVCSGPLDLDAAWGEAAGPWAPLSSTPKSLPGLVTWPRTQPLRPAQ